MKILWLSHLVPYPPKGGVLQRSTHLVKELSKYHEVYVLAFNQPDLIRPMFPSVEAGLKEAEQVLRGYCADIKFIQIPISKSKFGKAILALRSLFSLNSYTVNWLLSKEFQLHLNIWKNKYQFDLVHADTISLVPYARQFKDIPLSLDHHNIESHMMLRRAQLENNILKKAYFYLEGYKLKKYEKNNCPIFDINITCSDLDTQRLKEICQPPYTVAIANGVDTEYFKIQNKASIKKSIIFAGRLNAYTNRKAVLYLVETLWPQLKQRIPDLQCHIVGPNPPESIMVTSEHDSHLHVHGFVDDVRDYLAEADIYICPITDGGGTKLKILDALAMGKPIVGHAEAFEGINIKQGHNAMIVSNVDEYCQAIEKIFADNELRNRLATQARQLIEDEYSYLAIGKQLADEYTDLTSNSH